MSNLRPSHYQGKTIEPIDLIDSLNLGFYEGNIVKYVSRWRRKGGLEDLKKAQFYLERLIKKEEDEGDRSKAIVTE